ncbi:DMT family transporter [Paracoccus aminophilus]|uniref:S-adenosylmethionine uptake transporter n=1 Tax=Paracoccus aminophilus JCM 7686 TaxID=1367847 RepID=S5YY14_PARAH|nr:DMT family transporter [Paracoccus aminophilus]AGT10061.1 S-adenosylmethionine uptake transporter [Paracoccus aminophilus JCM 7686]
MNPSTGILLKILSVVVFTVMAAIIKLNADEIPAGQQVFFRSFFAIPVILGWLIWRHELSSGLGTKRPINHFYRGFIGTTAMGLNFAALGYLPFPEATALGYTAPLLTVIFAAMFLGEDVRAFRLISVLNGLVGVVIVLLPRLGVTSEGLTTAQTLGAVLVLSGAACSALAQIFIRKLVLEERTSVIVFWFSVTSSILALTTLPFGWVVPAPGTLVLLIVTGLLGGLGQILLTSSYRFAPASVVAPFEYASVILALAIGYLSFGEVPTLTMLVGSAIVIGAGIAIILRERQLGIERTRQRKAMTPQG